MKKIYGSIEANEVNLGKVGGMGKSKTEYYKMQDNGFGIEVVKTQQNEYSTTTEIKQIANITPNEAKINEILNILLDRRIAPYIAEEIIQDLMLGA